jgi:hypothetical protein
MIYYLLKQDEFVGGKGCGGLWVKFFVFNQKKRVIQKLYNRAQN